MTNQIRSKIEWVITQPPEKIPLETLHFLLSLCYEENKTLKAQLEGYQKDALDEIMSDHNFEAGRLV